MRREMMAGGGVDNEENPNFHRHGRTRPRHLSLERAKLLVNEIKKSLRTKVVGQPEAVDAVALALARFEAGMSDPNRPIGSFLFYGPSGVGKTEMARAIANYLFGDYHLERLKILNMAAFAEYHTISNLIGSPPGYVGHNEKSSIPHDWLHSGRSVVVFDEIEKAHPAIVKLLLSVLEEGYLMSRNGPEGQQELNFSNAVLIFTSNVGSQEVDEVLSRRPLGFASPNTEQSADAAEVAKRALKKHFPPEFLGRLESIPFHPLERSHLVSILDKYVREFNDIRALYGQPMVSLWPKAKARVIDESLKNQGNYGARNLRHTFEELIVSNLSLLYNSGQIVDGDSIEVNLDKNGNFYWSAL